MISKKIEPDLEFFHLNYHLLPLKLKFRGEGASSKVRTLALCEGALRSAPAMAGSPRKSRADSLTSSQAVLGVAQNPNKINAQKKINRSSFEPLSSQNSYYKTFSLLTPGTHCRCPGKLTLNALGGAPLLGRTRNQVLLLSQ